jgi:formylglycine-generating enzyme required for sulfatase activity
VTLQPGGYLAEATLFAVAPFAMARYPVTNACYAGFVHAGGYENSAWWSVAGWAAREKEKWTEPRHWHSPALAALPATDQDSAGLLGNSSDSR